MKELRLKKDVNFEGNKIYSICLRGARRYSVDNEVDLYIYTPNGEINPNTGDTYPNLASIVSQKQFRFCDLRGNHCIDNYDITARTLPGLEFAMYNVYDDFEETEIVTIVKFRIIPV